jgi:hypothetical protein
MDGIRNIAGRRTVSLQIDGKTYTLEPMVLAEYAEREAYILGLKPNPLEVLASLPPLPPEPQVPVPPDPEEGAEGAAAYMPKLAEYQRQKAHWEQCVAQRARLEDRAWKEANRPRCVSIEDEQHFDQSLHGIAWRLYRALRRHHPEVNGVQAALDLIERAGNSKLGQIVAAVDQAEERDILGNSDPPTGVGASEADASPGH